MFSLKPSYITLVEIPMMILMIGNAPRRASVKLHPFVKANVNPEMVIANAKIIVPIFSPRAFYIARHSLPNLAGNSYGLLVSNQALFYLKIA